MKKDMRGLYYRRDEGESSPTPEEPTPEVVAANLEQGPEPQPESPATEMEAVFELGVTQEAVRTLRQRVENCEASCQLSNEAAADLARMVADLSNDLQQVRQEEVRVKDEERVEKRAHWLEVMLGGS